MLKKKKGTESSIKKSNITLMTKAHHKKVHLYLISGLQSKHTVAFETPKPQTLNLLKKNLRLFVLISVVFQEGRAHLYLPEELDGNRSQRISPSSEK